MNWKKCLIVFINLAFLALPYNIIGCAGGDEDPYDYFVSFYNKNLSDVKGYEPFYYTDVQFLYHEDEPVKTADITSAEWVSYCNNSFSAADAYQFVCQYARKDLSSLYFHIEKGQPLQAPDSVQKNGMCKYFIGSKDLEALGYIMYAKQVEPNTTGSWSEWEPIERDSIKMAKLIKNGQQLHAVAKNNVIKLRLAYQVLRLAHYSKRYSECLQWYDELVKPNATPGSLQDLCLGLKAGSMMRLGQKKEAAVLFSQLFSKNELKRVSNYMSFDWCVQRFDENNRRECLALCKTNEDKANMLGLFIMGSDHIETPALKKIYQLSPKSSVLEILTLREMNKLEEHFFTPSMRFAQGKKETVIKYETISPADSSFLAWKKETSGFSTFCKQVADDKGTSNKGFYSLAAAHASLIGGDYATSRKLLDDTKKLSLPAKLKDQWAMSNLLLSINAKDTLDAAFEDQLMPSITWLQGKAAIDQEYGKFYRRLFADIICTKYKKSHNKVKELLCTGTAEFINKEYVKDGWGYWGNAIGILRYELTAQQIEQLVTLMESGKLSAFDKFIVTHNSFSKDDVNDVAGTAWLRQFEWSKAQQWFKKVSPAYYQSETYKTYLAANPFADLLLDTHAPTKQDTKKFSKLSFCQKMWALEQEIKTNKEPEKTALAYYEYAKGLYHMSYWGNSWMLVHYDWSGNDGMKGANEAQPGDKEYFGVYKAEECYMKAFGLTQDKNFKARCLFMAAKCEQKQITIPTYSAFKDYNDYDKAQVAYAKAIKQNKHFPHFVNEYKTTPFYKEAFNTCTYLQDFVNKK